MRSIALLDAQITRTNFLFSDEFLVTRHKIPSKLNDDRATGPVAVFCCGAVFQKHQLRSYYFGIYL